MNIVSKIYCRTFQGVLRIGMSVIKWPKPEVIKGENAFDLLNKNLKEKSLHKPLILLPSFLYKNEKIQSFLNKIENHYEIKDLINPTIDAVEEMVTVYKENKCDCIIAIGGGSLLDLGKGTAARVANPKKSLKKMKGVFKVTHKLVPLYAIPTTAGSGSEATVAAVISDSVTHEKFPINDTKLVPGVAVLEPTLTVSLPKYLTAITGMDALTHAIECYIGGSNTKQTRKDSIEAVKLIFANLKDAYEDGTNIQARENMQMAAFLAGAAFTRGYVGYVHALAHQLGGLYNVQHGEANAILLPFVLESYGKKGYKRLKKLAMDIGKPDLDIIEEIKKMNQFLGIPTYVKELKKEDFNTISKRACKEGNPLYPVPVIFNSKELNKILERVLVN
ncbi:MAG: iron-containing alcohol dehydrogenase [Bacilli bacterium]